MKKNFLSLSVLLFIALVLSGCVAAKPYYWGTYSNSLYALRKDGSEENLLKHQKVLEEIVTESTQRGLPVPPGVYGELGYIYFRQNKRNDAIRFFDLEEKTYPESRILMQRLIQAAKAREGESKVTAGVQSDKTQAVPVAETRTDVIQPETVQPEKDKK